MKRLFLYGFLGGVAIALLAAALWPLPQHERARSLIAVQPDGGREEAFLIRWPEDRLPVGPEAGERTSPGNVALLEHAGERVSASLFRLRNADGRIIGVAGRASAAGRAGVAAGKSASEWLLVIPSRGALFLTQHDAIDATARRDAAGSPARAPAETAGFWGDVKRASITAPGQVGRLLRGTNEFDALVGSYTESWEVDEINADGTTRGRIILSTLTSGIPQ